MSYAVSFHNLEQTNMVYSRVYLLYYGISSTFNSKSTECLFLVICTIGTRVDVFINLEAVDLTSMTRKKKRMKELP